MILWTWYTGICLMSFFQFFKGIDLTIRGEVLRGLPRPSLSRGCKSDPESLGKWHQVESEAFWFGTWLEEAVCISSLKQSNWMAAQGGPAVEQPTLPPSARVRTCDFPGFPSCPHKSILYICCAGHKPDHKSAFCLYCFCNVMENITT